MTQQSTFMMLFFQCHLILYVFFFLYLKKIISLKM